MDREGSSGLCQHSCPQAIWSRVIWRAPHEPRQRLTLSELPTARRARPHVIAQCCRGLRIELAIEIGVKVAFYKFAAHRSVSLSDASFGTVCS